MNILQTAQPIIGRDNSQIGIHFVVPGGREIFYRQGDKLVVADIAFEPRLEVGRPQLLFEGLDAALFPRSYDVTADGRRFVTTRANEGSRTQLNVVLNWFEELERLVPTD